MTMNDSDCIAIHVGRVVRSAFAILCLLMIGLISFVDRVHGAEIRDESPRITKSTGPFGVELSVRLYAPLGDGPFPLVVINHGKANGLSKWQVDDGFYFQSLQFVQREYAVLIPVRQGFGSSGGNFTYQMRRKASSQCACREAAQRRIPRTCAGI